MYPRLAQIIQDKAFLKARGWYYVNRTKKFSPIVFWLHLATGERARTADEAITMERRRVRPTTENPTGSGA